MSYLKEVETALRPMLATLAEAKQKEVIKFVKGKVLASYFNGLNGVGKGAEKKLSTKRAGGQSQ